MARRSSACWPVPCALRYHRRLAPFLLGSALILSCRWPKWRKWSAAWRRSSPLRRRCTCWNSFVTCRARGCEPETLPLNIRYYRPAGEGPHPGLIDIYGGAWQRGAPEDSPAIRQLPGTQRVRGIRHRLPARPGVPFPRADRGCPRRDRVRSRERRAISHRPGPFDSLRPIGRRPIGIAGGLRTRPGTDSCGDQLLRPDRSGSGLRRPAFARPDRRAPGAGDLPGRLAVSSAGGLSHRVAGHLRTTPDCRRRYSSKARAIISSRRAFPGNSSGKLLAAGNRAVLLEIPWSEHAFDAVFRGIGNRLALHYIEQFLAQQRRYFAFVP